MGGSMKDKRVFVSGGAGVIGRELVGKLAYEYGAHVFSGDLKPNPFSSLVQHREGDLGLLLKSELERFEPEIFFHLAAAFERSEESPEHWDENYRHNVNLSHRLMTIAKELPSLKTVVFASSYLVYDPILYLFANPLQSAVHLKESSRIRPRNLTGAAKLFHEMELEFLADHTNLQIISARIFRGYGKGSRDVISRWIRDLIQGKAIEVYRPENIFDFIYASDTAEGLIRLSESNNDGHVNLGTGKGRAIQHVLDILRSHFPSMQTIYHPDAGFYEATQADTLVMNQTGWRPQYTLERGIEEIIAFERSKAL
jgi:carbamoyl-phosphate synthase large subunit